MIRILYVDDEEDIREVVSIALSLDPELDVRLCDGGPAALEAAASWQPALILLDFMMPGMDGPATLGKLRENPRTAELPVVFVTARSAPSDVAQLMSLGAKGVIAKPFDPMALSADVRRYVP